MSYSNNTPENSNEHRFYGDFASWWPLISAVEEYKEEAAYTAKLLGLGDAETESVLELGSGGGNNAAYLKEHFTMTLVDLAAGMLEVSRRQNPECRHIQADMRVVRLDESFDAVFVHDAIDYMTTETDLELVMSTAFLHCRPGGVAVFMPDHTTENFEPSTEHGGSDGPDGRSVRYLEWTIDPDPDDSWVETEYSFLFRDVNGTVTAAHETHRTGLFSKETWLGLLRDQGFVPEVLTEETEDDRTPRLVFLGRVPN